MTPELHALIEDAYAAFSVYRPGRHISCLSRAMPDELEHSLLNTPLRMLPRAGLEGYTRYACAHGMPLDPWWPYFLPRYFDLIARYEWPSASGAENALMCLYGGVFRDTMHAAELAIIDAFARAFLLQFVNEPVRAIDDNDLEIVYAHCGLEDAFAIVVMFARGGFAPADLVLPWLADERTAPTLHLASLVNYLFRAGRRFMIGRELVMALATPRVHRRIERAMNRAPDASARRMLQKAERHLHDALASSIV